jgi:hypothetical protein
MVAMLLGAPLLTGCGTTTTIKCNPIPPVPLPPPAQLPVDYTETDATDIDTDPSDYTDWWNGLSSDDQATWESWWDSF